MATLKDLENYKDYEFSTGVFTGKDYLSFQTKYINYLKSMCKEKGWELVNVGRNHYCFSCFIKNDKKYIYLSISDVRFSNGWYNNLLVRTALHEKDYHGGGNCYTSLPLLNFAIKTLFERGHYCENAFYSIGL